MRGYRRGTGHNCRVRVQGSTQTNDRNERVSSRVEHTMSVVKVQTGQWSQNANNFRNNATEETSEENLKIGIRAQKRIGFGMRCMSYVLAEHLVKKKKIELRENAPTKCCGCAWTMRKCSSYSSGQHRIS